MSEEERLASKFFAIRTTKGQEYSVALLMENRARSNALRVYSIVATPKPGGVVIVEAPSATVIDPLTRDLRHVRGRVKGVISREEVESMIKVKPVVELLSPGMEVEVIAGPLRGVTGKVLQVSKERNEVVIMVYEAAYPLKVTVPGEHVKPLSKR